MVIDLILERLFDNKDCTLGTIKDITPLRRTFLGFSCEDQKQNGPKLKGETRIPPGRYRLVLNKVETDLTLKYRKKYPWFKWHIMLQGVQGFAGIYIHIGNNDDDTDGCILMGDIASNIVLTKNFAKAIQESTVSFERFYKEYTPLIEKEEVYITVVDEKY
jgi:hypothetical protein